MSATLYINELGNLITETKRRNPDIRTAAEKSLQDLKSITITSEQQLAADLSRRPTFAEPFIKACATGNSKLAVSGVSGLQKLVISRGLPKQRLDDSLQAFNACTELNLDIQLKVLQALPSLVENYSDELRGDLLAAALQVCAVLQSAKVATVSAVAAATFQQLVTSVFDRLAQEDSQSAETPTVTEVPGDDGPIPLRPAAFDAYRVFRDLLLLAEGRKTRFVQFAALSKDASLELLSSCMEAKPHLIDTHDELSSMIRSNVMPLVTAAISEKSSFATMVRCARILVFISTRYFAKFAAECEVALGLFSHVLESDNSPLWKRVLLMEALRDLFAENNIIVMAYIAFDQGERGKPVIQELMASLVRLSAEKPAVIGLGRQSSVPVGPSAQREQAEQSILDSTGGMAGMLSSLGVVETNVQGIGTEWSIPKTPCIEQLDKSEASQLPETYLYSLVLDCLNGLSENLAKIILPLTVHHERSKQKKTNDGTSNSGRADVERTTRQSRSESFRKQTVPLNPLALEHSPTITRVKAVAGLIETCWPAALATCSTFLNAALDDTFYRGLIKSFQRFAQVAGLLRLDTPRDAFLTTLGKAAVPPQVLNAAMSDHIRSPTAESPRVFSNPRSLLNVDSLVGHASSNSSEKERRSSTEQIRPVLTIRNLLCLRALLNLTIALGPTLEDTYALVMDVVKQADVVLGAAGSQQISRTGTTTSNKNSDIPSGGQSFSTEVAAVEGAASRLLESTADYPNDAFLMVLRTFCRMIHGNPRLASLASISEEPRTPTSPSSMRRNLSGLPGITSFADMQARNYQFALPKLSSLAALNVPRFVTNDPTESGWVLLTEETLAIATTNSIPVNSRKSATDLLCNLAAKCISEVEAEDEEDRGTNQRRALEVLLNIVTHIYDQDDELTTTDLEVQAHVIDALKSILERSGESIIVGWDKIIAIVSSVFECDQGTASKTNDDVTDVEWTHVSNDFISPRLGRDAFSVVQLVCSDFLSLVPTTAIPDLIELLHRFMSQSQDLNLSLTAITIAWNFSDVLFDASAGDALGSFGADQDGATSLEKRLSPSVKKSKPAQWLMLLTKLRQIVHTGQREASKAAFQIICSICKNHGAHLPPKAWELLLRHILIGVVADDAESPDWRSRDLTALLLGGISEIISQHVSTIGSISRLQQVWSMFTSILDKLLDRASFETSTAVYQALAAVLAQIASPLRLWTEPVRQTVQLWSRRIPSQDTPKPAGDGNQRAFCAYAELATQLVHLTEDQLSEQQTRALVVNLSQCIRLSGASYHNADSYALTQLQSQVLGLFKGMRKDLKPIPSGLIFAGAEFTRLHGVNTAVDTRDNRPSFVALAAESITWLQQLLTTHASDEQVIRSGALRQGVSCIADVIEEKYRFKMEYKGSLLWQRATEVAVALVRTILELADRPTVDDETRLSLWTDYVRITCNVAQANGMSSFDNTARIYQDEESDIHAFKALQAILIPRLGDDRLPDDLRGSYTRSLFEASMVHAIEAREASGFERSPLESIQKTRRGRVKEIHPSKRERMSYECLSQLVALSCRKDDSTERRKLAQSAAPLLVLRLAIPIRAYIADQPLRGRMPQPLSELEELLYCFEQIRTVRLNPGALTADRSKAELHGERAHLHYLYPVLAQAVRVAGDRWCGSEEVLKPLQALLEEIAPWPA